MLHAVPTYMAYRKLRVVDLKDLQVMIPQVFFFFLMPFAKGKIGCTGRMEPD